METIYRDKRIHGVEIRWSGGATFNIWVEGFASDYYNENDWHNADCFTHYGKGGAGNTPTPIEAAHIAEERFDQMWEEETDRVFEETKDTEDIWHDD